jgi:flagellar biosynthetic protein FliR
MEIPVDWAVPQLLAFLLVVGRLSGLFLLAPVLSSKLIPVRIKVMALLVLGLTMTPFITHGVNLSRMPIDGLHFAMLMGKETLVGLALGFSIATVFASVQLAASMLDTSIGFSLANIIDPTTSNQSTVLGSFYSMVATLAFLSVQGHQAMLRGLAHSYQMIGLLEMPSFHHILVNAESLFVGLFSVGFQMASPVLVTLLMVDVVLGIVSRTVPQMNVFFVGIPLKIAVGLGAIIIGMPTFVNFFEHRVDDVASGVAVLADSSTRPNVDAKGGGAG